MAKVIVVTRDQVESSHRKLEKLLAKDPQWAKEQKEMERWAAEEKKRRDADYAAKQGAKESEKEAE